MSYGYDHNVYYSPEKSDLKAVGEIEYSSREWEFDTRAVWIHTPTGRLLTARDSGCSCPSPFESYSLDKLEDITVEYESFLMSEYKADVESHKGWRESYARRENVESLIEDCRVALARLEPS